jgi:hypothetical protein
VDEGFEGIAHPALLDGANDENLSKGDQVFLKREQISALGCDRYCSC